MSLKETFNSMPNSSNIEAWEHEHSVGFLVNWSETGRGFGQYAFYVDKGRRKFMIDNECDGPITLKRVMDRLVDENPEEIKKLFHTMIDNGYFIDKN